MRSAASHPQEVADVPSMDVINLFIEIDDRQWVVCSDWFVVSCPIAGFGSDVPEEGANGVP
jgi:hypothetical protein